jgi:hypothetical protein
VKTVLVVLIGCLLIGNVLAQDDEICIIFDYPNSCAQNCLAVGVGETFSFHVVLQNASRLDGLSGYEFCICNDNGLPLEPPAGQYYITSYDLPPSAINVMLPPCFVVGLAPCLAWQPCILLLTVNIASVGVEPWCFGIDLVYPDPLDYNIYAACDDPGDYIPMLTCTGGQARDCYMACVNSANCPPPVPVEGLTWGQVKGLYN